MKVAGATLLAGLHAHLTRPDTVNYVSETISERPASVLRERPTRQEALRLKRAEVRVKLENPVRALESGASASAVVQAIHVREQERAALDQELGGPEESLDGKLTVIAKAIIAEDPDLARPENKHRRLEAIESVYERGNKWIVTLTRQDLAVAAMCATHEDDLPKA